MKVRVSLGQWIFASNVGRAQVSHDAPRRRLERSIGVLHIERRAREVVTMRRRMGGGTFRPHSRPAARQDLVLSTRATEFRTIFFQIAENILERLRSITQLLLLLVLDLNRRVIVLVFIRHRRFLLQVV